MATWHAYVKLRMHTTYTINSLRSQTKELGRLLRRYANKVCPKYNTKPLPGEAAAADRRQAAKGKKVVSGSGQASAPNARPNGRKGCKQFNLKTYKIHALGDYADHIEQFGPTDCFSTQQVRSLSQFHPPPSPLPTAGQGELEHRRVKRFYKRTNKMRFEHQIAKHERMERRYRKYINMLRKKTGARTTSRPGLSSDIVEDVSPRQHYSVAKRDRDHVDLYAFSAQHVGDPTLKVRDVSHHVSLSANTLLGLRCEAQGSPPCPHSQQSV